jgi:hypothetical protein
MWLFQRLLLNYDCFDRVSPSTGAHERASISSNRSSSLLYSSRRFSSFYGYPSYAVMDNLSQPSQLRLDAPNLAKEWTTWLEDWELHSTGSGLQEKPAATQRAYFFTAVGPEARLKFKGFTLSEADRLDLNKIKEAFARFLHALSQRSDRALSLLAPDGGCKRDHRCLRLDSSC